MNILQVTLGFYPATSWGGPVKIVYENSLELIRRGHQVTIYCTNLFDKKRTIQPGTFEREIEGIRVVYFDTLRIPYWPGTLGPIWLPALGSLLEKEIRSYDLIHINSYRTSMNQVVAKLARQHEIPFIIQPHGSMQAIISSVFIKKIYDQVFGGKEIEGMSRLIALQEKERQQAIMQGVPEDRIEIIPNGLGKQIHTPEKGTFRRRYQIPSTSPLVLFLGRINKKKGTDLLVKSFTELLDLDPYLAIVGPDDGQLDEVKALVEKYNLQNRIRLTGLLSGEEIASAYTDSDLFVLPCRTDTFPTTIMEACYYSLPMLVTDGCESADIIKDRVADIVPFDEKAFANGMRRLLVDRPHYIKYQRACSILTKEEFSIEATVNRLESLYFKVLNN